MFIDTEKLLNVVLSVLFFPLFFQKDVLMFVWGAGDPMGIMLAKRVLLLLPAMAMLMACWLSMVCLLTVIVRQNRKEFMISIFVTWWDLGRATFWLWGGAFKFLFYLVASIFGLLKFLMVGLWILIQDFVLMPFRLVRSIGQNVLSPGIPWIAVGMTLVWSLLEAAIFTYVTSPLVIDTFSNMTGDQLSENTIRIPLFLFMFFIVLGSYSVLSTWADAIRSKNVGSIVKIGVIEAVAMFVEIIFLYREFVDSLVPWFAQHTSGDFQLGIVGTLLISAITWIGVRGISWFLFASHGTPTIMAVIRGTGVRVNGGGEHSKGKDQLTLTTNFINQIKGEMATIQKMGDELLGSFIIPPLQVLAAAVNFLTLLITMEHLFDLPFRNMEEVMHSKALLQGGSKRKIKVV